MENNLAAKHSLQNDISNHILNPQQMFDFGQQSIKEIDFFFISISDALVDVPMLDNMFKNVETLPGTRSFHEFIPISERHIAAERCSGDETYDIKHDLLKLPAEPQIKVLSYVTCSHDNEWRVGIILEINKDERDILVKFMTPNGPAGSFKWPEPDDTVWVPFFHILCNIDVPSLSIISGRQYNLSKTDVKNTSGAYTEKQKNFCN